MIIVIAPSGGGKSTFLKKVLSEREDLMTTITSTTRKMRKGESEGDPYHFVSQERFFQLKEDNFFVEWAVVHGNYYGTPKTQIDEIWSQSKHVIMDVDIQGADSLKKVYPEALTVFILPPSIEELRRRVTCREGKVPEDLEVRMNNAQKEIARAEEYDRQLVNDNFETSYLEFKKMIEEYLDTP